jgi:hypothetical protein
MAELRRILHCQQGVSEREKESFGSAGISPKSLFPSTVRNTARSSLGGLRTTSLLGYPEMQERVS